MSGTGDLTLPNAGVTANTATNVGAVAAEVGTFGAAMGV